jgi:serine protease SohB
MIDALIHLGVFFLEALVVLATILIVAAGLIGLITRGRERPVNKIVITDLNKQFQRMKDTLQASLQTTAEQKQAKKNKKREKKKAKKKKLTRLSAKKHVFVIDFQGDLKASGVERLRQEISAILSIATPKDEVVVRLESPGGVVHGYGLAASQLQRIRTKKIPLTISIDKVAASGGYLMACVGDKILAAPFAIIGSIGVLAQIPNFHKLLEKHHIDFEQITAGEYKRTLTMFGKNTEKGREKMQESISEIHTLFKNFIKEQRPAVDLAKTATGEYWLAKQAHPLKLVDELQTSDDYLMQLEPNTKLRLVRFAQKKTWTQKMGSQAHAVINTLFRPPKPYELS